MGCSIRNLPRQLANTEAFAEEYLCFLVSASARKYTKAIKFLGLIKKYFSKNDKKNWFKKRNFLLNKKIFLIFKLDCITQITYFIIHICLYSLFILLLFSYISLQETGLRKNTNPFLLIEMAKN